MIPDSEQEIIKLLQQGQAQVFHYIYKKYYNELCLIARGYLIDRYLSETVVEDVISHVWEHHQKIRINSSLRNYLIKSTVNRCINMLELEYVKREQNCTQEDITIYCDLWRMGNTPHEILESSELFSSLNKAIDSLPAKTKEILIMSKIEKKKSKEISEQLGIPIATVKYHLKIAIEKLQEKLKILLIILLLAKNIIP